MQNDDDDRLDANVQAIDRFVGMLGALSDGPKQIAELCRELEVTRGVAQRLLTSLRGKGMVSRSGGASFVLGLGYLALIQSSQKVWSFVALLRKDIEDLRNVTGETIALSIRRGAERYVVFQAESTAHIRYSEDIGGGRPLHLGAAGRVLLAHVDEKDQRKLIAALPAAGEDALPPGDRARLAGDLRAILQRGYDIGARLPGTVGIAAPLMFRGRIAAAVGIVGPAARFPVEAQPDFVQRLKASVQVMERRLSVLQSVDHLEG